MQFQLIYHGRFDYFAVEYLMTVAELQWFYFRLVDEKKREEAEMRKAMQKKRY